MLFPPIKTNDANYIPQNLLQSCALAFVLNSAIKSALNDDGVEVGKNFVLLQDHRASPRAIVNSEIEDPLVRGRLPNVV